MDAFKKPASQDLGDSMLTHKKWDARKWYRTSITHIELERFQFHWANVIFESHHQKKWFRKARGTARDVLNKCCRLGAAS